MLQSIWRIRRIKHRHVWIYLDSFLVLEGSVKVKSMNNTLTITM